jgi:uncharacterized RDD family membrane protein YckC
MARSARPPESPLLFDLPLTEAEPAGARPRPAETPAEPPTAPPPAVQAGLEFDEPYSSWEDEVLPSERAEAEVVAPPERGARLGERFRAGAADLGLHLAVGLGALVGADLLGARPDLGDFPAVGLFLLAFSLFYTTVPLAFWGATPGMAWAGLVCRAPGEQTLSFGQTVRHWLGSLLTLGLLGLPTLLGFGGRPALSDRLAGTRTFRETG